MRQFPLTLFCLYILLLLQVRLLQSLQLISWTSYNHRTLSCLQNSRNVMKISHQSASPLFDTVKIHDMSTSEMTKMVSRYFELSVETKRGIDMTDLTPALRQILHETPMKEGTLNLLTTHTTTALTINEMESRLLDDTRQYLLKLAPPNYPYLHNDIHLRYPPSNFQGDVETWRAQEPINCHAHLLSMLIGTTLSVPVHDSQLMIGQWQSVIFVELDGPRTRKIGVQISGYI